MNEPYEAWQIIRYFDGPRDLRDGDLLICPSCDAPVPTGEWLPCESGPCEVCGDHEAMMCPRCNDYFDIINRHDWRIAPAKR